MIIIAHTWNARLQRQLSDCARRAHSWWMMMISLRDYLNFSANKSAQVACMRLARDVEDIKNQLLLLSLLGCCLQTEISKEANGRLRFNHFAFAQTTFTCYWLVK